MNFKLVWIVLFCVYCLIGEGAFLKTYGQTVKQKRLIEFGWDEPDTAFMKEHIEEMERTPFEGCVFHINYTRPVGEPQSFLWEAWGKKRFKPEQLDAAISELKTTKFQKFKHNFLRFNTTPADLDWFDDYSAVVNNATLAAKVANEGGCKGILFDVEEYANHLFTYANQRDKAAKSWDAYALQAHLRGKQVMEGFQKGYPDLIVFLTYGYGLPWDKSQEGRKPLEECDYGLLAPFLDGMISAAKGKTRFIDGNESAYWYSTPAHFSRGKSKLQKDVRQIIENPVKYAKIFSVSFGVWMDFNWREQGWNTKDLAKNPRSPKLLEELTRKALSETNEYVWVYSETPRWWSASGKSEKLPLAYDTALRNALK